MLYEDSYRNVALAINRGSAAQILRSRAGQELLIAVQRV
jgi:S-adenosylmethionine hydrolase